MKTSVVHSDGGELYAFFKGFREINNISAGLETGFEECSTIEEVKGLAFDTDSAVTVVRCD